jgi:hypothetical protein
MVMYGSYEEGECLERVAKLWWSFDFIRTVISWGTQERRAGRARTLLAMIASSGASNGACGPRRAPAADASYALEVCRNSAVRSRACLAGDAGVVASK